jgi:plasmid stability protein
LLSYVGALSINDIKIVKRRLPTKQQSQPTVAAPTKAPVEEQPFDEQDMLKLIEEQRPSEFRPAWKQRFDEKQKELPPIQQAAKKAIEFNGRLDASVRATMGLEPYEGLQPPSYELPLKIRDFAAEAAQKAREQQAQQQKDESELTQDKFVKMLPDDLQARLKVIEARYKQLAEEEAVDEQAADEVEAAEEAAVEEVAAAEEQPPAAEEQAPVEVPHEEQFYAIDEMQGMEVEDVPDELDFMLNDNDHSHIQPLDEEAVPRDDVE